MAYDIALREVLNGDDRGAHRGKQGAVSIFKDVRRFEKIPADGSASLPYSEILKSKLLFIHTLLLPRSRFLLPAQITSANVRSILRKCHMPLTRSRMTPIMEAINPGQKSVFRPPRMHQRNPSITPTIGFNE